MEENTTWDLVKDTNALREHLNIQNWLVIGGSWGSTLALAYAQTYPKSVAALVVRGIFIGQKYELDWAFKEGASRIFPKEWQRFLQLVPTSEQSAPLSYYHKAIHSKNEQLQAKAAIEW